MQINDAAQGTLDVALNRAREHSNGTRFLSVARIALDAAVAAAAAGVALLLRFQLGLLAVTETSPLTVGAHVLASCLWTSAVVIAVASNRLYDEDTLFPGGGEKARVLRSIIEAGAGISLFVFLTQSFYVSRSWFALTLLLSLGGLIAQREIVRRHLRIQRARGRMKRPSFLVSREGEVWSDWYDVRNQEFEVVAELDADGVERMAAAVLSDPEVRQSLAGSALVLRARDFDSDQFWNLVLRAGQLDWSVFVHSPVRSVGRDRLTVRDIAGHTIVKVGPPSLSGMRALQKRFLDIVVSLAALVVLSPVLIVILITVAISSKGSPIYRQERVGRRGRIFTMWKFRTMRIDAEAESGPVWTTKDDPRRTPVGGFLRRTSLDELPQLWNVLKGEMSLVGPRPERPNFVDEFEISHPWYHFRHRIRPGLTGWAQAQGLRGDTALGPRLESDNWYIENWSIWLDLRILVATLREVVRGTNAH